MTNINIGPLLKNRKGYLKNETCSGNNFLNFFDCTNMENVLVFSNQSPSWPELVSPYLQL